MGLSTPGILVVNGTETPGVLERYKKIKLPENWKRVWFQKNVGCNAAANKIVSMFPDEPWYGGLADDEWVNTPDFDKTLITAAGSWNIANANAGRNSEQRVQSFPTFGGDLVRCVGWLALPGLFHWFGENTWEYFDAHIVPRLRVFCKDIAAEHRHFTNSPVEKDEAYSSQDNHRNTDAWTYQHWIESGEPAAIMERIVGQRKL